MCQCVRCPGVKQTPAANRREQATTRKRKQVLEMLSGIVEKKRRTLDANEEPETTDQLPPVGDAISAPSSGIPEKQRPLFQASLKSHSSSLEKGNIRNRENHPKSMAKEPDRCDMSSPGESFLESGRSSRSSCSSKQSFESHKRSEPDREHSSTVAGSASRSKRRSRPLASPRRKRKLSGDKNQSGPVCEANSDNVMWTVVDAVSVPMDIVSGNSDSEQMDDVSSKPNSEQFGVQETEHSGQELHQPFLIAEHEGEVITIDDDDDDEPLSVITVEPECLYDAVDPFEFSPPRQVKLKFRDGGAKPCADTDTEGQTSQTSPTKLSRSSHSQSPHPKQLSEDSVENFRWCKPGSRPSLLSHSLSPSKQPPTSRNVVRKSPADVSRSSGSCKNSETENEHCDNSKKPLLHHGAPKREYSQPGGNNYGHRRGLFFGGRTYLQRLPSKGQFRQVAERSERQENDREDQYGLRYEREIVNKNEPVWQHWQEETSWQDKECADNTWSDIQYSNRCEDGSQQPDGVFDLRQKLNMRYHCSNQQREDNGECYYGREARGQVTYNDQERSSSYSNDSRRCLLRAPPHYEVIKDDDCYSNDRNYNSPRRAWCGDSAGQLRESLRFSQDADYRCWRQAGDYITSAVKREPHSWNREVRWHSFFCNCFIPA